VPLAGVEPVLEAGRLQKPQTLLSSENYSLFLLDCAVTAFSNAM